MGADETSDSSGPGCSGQWRIRLLDQVSEQQIAEITSYYNSDVDHDDRSRRFCGALSNEALAIDLRRRLPTASLVVEATAPGGQLVGLSESYRTEVCYSDPFTGSAVRSEAYEISCVVASRLQRRGIGRSLVCEAVRAMVRDGACTFLLVTATSNGSAVAFLRKTISILGPSTLCMEEEGDTTEFVFRMDGRVSSGRVWS
jgi:ribosomal protein S18 acetylase RimI-like enzyme